MEEAANALASRAIASGDLRPDVDPIDLMRAIYGLSAAGSADDWPAKARKFADILLQAPVPDKSACDRASRHKPRIRCCSCDPFRLAALLIQFESGQISRSPQLLTYS
jgi:hypothetical protein